MKKEKKSRFFGNLGDPNNPIKVFERASSETKFCPNCGEKIDAKAEICPKCGVRFVLPLKESPQGGARILLYVISFLIPLIGIILGVIYLTKPSQDAHDFGVACLLIGIIPFSIAVILLAI